MLCAPAILSGAVPAWVLQAYGPAGIIPSLALHFDSGRYFVRGIGEVDRSVVLSNSRSGTRWYKNTAGVYVSAASGTLVIPDGTGAPLLQAITNLLWNSGFLGTPGGGGSFPTNWGVVGLQGSSISLLPAESTLGISSQIVRYTRVGASGFEGLQNSIAESANTYVVSVYVRKRAGVAATDLFAYCSGGTPSSTTVATAAQINAQADGVWTLRTAVVTLTAGSTAFGFMSPSGTIGNGWDIALPMLVANPFFFDSPVVSGPGASATVGADIAQLIGKAAEAAVNAKSLFAQTNAVAGGAFPSMLRGTFGGGAGTQGIYYTASTTQTVTDGNNSANDTIGASGNYAGTVKTAASFDNIGMAIRSNGGTVGTQATSAWSTNLGPTIYLGNLAAGNRALNGLMQRFALYDVTKGAFDGITA